MTQWGHIGDLTYTPLKWWCGSLCIWDIYIQESWQHQKIWAWPNDSIKAPPEDQGKMKSNHQPNVHLVTGDVHANQWRSTNLNRIGNMPQYGIRCVIGRKNQMVSSHLSSGARPSSSKSITQKEKHDDNQNAEKYESNWMAPERLY